MTDIPHPLRRQLLIRCTLDDDVCPEVERDRILQMFPGLNPPDALAILAEIREHRRCGNPNRAEQLIKMLIDQDQGARKT